MTEKTQLQFIWKQVKEKAQELISPVSFNAYIEDLEPIDLVGRKLILKATTDLRANAIMEKNNLCERLRLAIEKCDLGLVNDFRLVVDGSETYSLEMERESEIFQSAPINSAFTFDSFVTGAGSKFVYAAAKSVAEAPGESFNPLFIYGESGLGKTHLMHAIANYIAKHYPEKKVLYTTCENFLNEFIDSIAQKSSAKFRLRYRNVDVLMIDDIQFLKDKRQVQEEFFHTFNELIINGCKIVLTSDRPASEIQIEDRLISRFQQGISADITPPNLEVRIAILLRKAAMKHFDFTQHPGLLEFVAQNITRNVRNLEGAVNTLARYLEISNKSSLTPADAEAILSNLLRQEEGAKITPEYIQRLVADAYRIEVEQMTRKGRGRAEIAFARQVAMFLCREVIDITLSAIGDAFGGRDHGTVLNAVKAVTNRMTTSDADRTKIAQLRSKLNATQTGA